MKVLCSFLKLGKGNRLHCLKNEEVFIFTLFFYHWCDNIQTFYAFHHKQLLLHIVTTEFIFTFIFKM